MIGGSFDWEHCPKIRQLGSKPYLVIVISMQTCKPVSAIRKALKGAQVLNGIPLVTFGRTEARCPGIVGTELRGARRAEICGIVSSDWSPALI